MLEVDLDPEAPDVYRIANESILDQALALGSADTLQVLAIIVWEGQSRGPDDNTAAFLASAEKRGIQVRSVLTTP